MQYNLGRFILKPRGTYSSNATYDTLDVVLYLGSSYVCKSDGVTNKVPTNTTFWQLMAAAGEATMTEQQKQEIIASLMAQGVVIDANYNTYTTAEKQKLQSLTAPQNGTLTLNYGDTRIGTFSANQGGNTTVYVPTPNNAFIKLIRADNDNEIGVFSVDQKEDQVIRIPVGSGGGTANNGTLTIQQGGTNVGTFTANQATNTTINLLNQSLTIKKNGSTIATYNPRSAQTCDITVPTAVTDLTDGGNYPTYRQLVDDATSGQYDTLDGDCVITELQENYVYYCSNATSLNVIGYHYDVNDLKCLTMPVTYILIETDSQDFDIETRDLPKIKLTRDSSLSLLANETYIITVVGFIWRIERLV